MTTTRATSPDHDQRRALFAVWAFGGGLGGLVAVLPGLLHVAQPWTVVLILAGMALGAGMGCALGAIVARLRLTNIPVTVQLVAALAWGLAASGSVGWNWLYPSVQDALDSYGDGCLANTPFGSHTAMTISGPAAGDDRITVVARSGDAVQFHFPANTIRAELTPADQHTRTALAAAGCPPR